MILGKYHVIAELGSGGMAKVYLAVSEGTKTARFEKLVVIKRPKEDFVTEPEIMSMFLDEARIAARLNHPNVVQTLDVGEEEALPFLAMEYLDGQPLHRILRRAGDKMPRSMLYAIVADALAGLHHAHELKDFDGKPLRVIHRDFTPHNIFVTYDGQVKVLDFGIAKAEGRASQTSIGVVKGKVTYMSPEQVQGVDLDRRSDLFAAGLILFEVATRSRFWSGYSDADIVRRLLSGELPSFPGDVSPPVAGAVERLCTKALAWDRDERYGSAAELQSELEAYLRHEGTRPTPREVGELVASLFADRRKALQNVIDGQLGELKRLRQSPSASIKLLDAAAMIPSEPTMSTSNQLGSMPPGRRTSRPSFPSIPAADQSVSSLGGTSSPPSLVVPPLPAATSRNALVGGGLVAAAIVAAAFIVSNGNQRTAVLSPMPRLPAVPHPQVEAADVKVILRGTPLETRFRIDDGEWLENPHAGIYRRDGKEHRVLAESPGHAPQNLVVRFDHDTTLGVALTPMAPAASASVAGKK